MSTTSQFWHWFEKHNKAYIFLSSVENDVKEELLSEFLKKLHLYCDNLYFEIGGHPDQDQELIITAEGDKDYFTKVEELIKDAPLIKGWTFIAFKPPMHEHFKTKWEEIELNTEDLWFIPLSTDESTDLGIRIFVKNYDLIENKDLLLTVLFKMLDTILGEKSFALDISYVDADLQPDDPEENGLYPILDLPEYIIFHRKNTQKSSS